MKDVILTPEGYEKLKQEIEYLSNDKRREVAERIKTAREFGDIAENAEYDDAKNEQALLEHRIATLEERLRNARVIDTGDVTTDVVSVAAGDSFSLALKRDGTVTAWGYDGYGQCTIPTGGTLPAEFGPTT